MPNSGSYVPPYCPYRNSGVGCRRCCDSYGHGGGGVQPGGLSGEGLSNIETFVGAFIENLSVAIAVKLKAMEVFPQDARSDLPRIESPVEIVQEKC